MKIKRALVSVSDKSGLRELGHFLVNHGVEIWASGGTRAALQEQGIDCIEISKEIDQAEMLEGRVKTLNSKIAAGILYRRDSELHRQHQKEFEFKSIDLVICNFYPFADVYESKADFKTCVEKIDIGGPTLVRSAAKNFSDVAVLTSHQQYSSFMAEWVKVNGEFENVYLQKLAQEAWQVLVSYDLKIQEFWLHHDFETSRFKIKYGENPHQKAWFVPPSTKFEKLGGEDLSYNNLNDLDCGLRIASDFKKIGLNGVAILKHGNPCGVASAESSLRALELAWQSDPVSAFGGVVCFSSEVDESSAVFLKERFVELIAAPSFSPSALILLSHKARLKLIQVVDPSMNTEFETKTILGGLLTQERDARVSAFQNLKCVTDLEFSELARELTPFGEICVKALKSNAVCVVRKCDVNAYQLIAFGSGQTNRVDCVTKLIASKIKLWADIEKEECLVVSDAFFPFSDSVEELKKLGFKYILQPGGSKKDHEVIAKCNELKVSMALTGVRHFFH